MKKAWLVLLVAALTVTAVPSWAFVDYLFGGSNSGAVGNSVLGDVRAWWTGNPVYEFNPFYRGQTNPQQMQSQGQQQDQQYTGQFGADTSAPPPAVNYYGPQQQSPMPYGMPNQAPQAAPQAAYPPQGYAPQPQQQYYQPQAQAQPQPSYQSNYGPQQQYQQQVPQSAIPPAQPYQAPPQYQPPAGGYQAGGQ